MNVDGGDATMNVDGEGVTMNDRTDALAPLPEDWRRALAIAAHPDDLEYGVAAAVAAWTDAGREVGYLLVTRGEAGIAGMAPERAGAAAVGVTTVEFLTHHDGVIVEGPALHRDLARALRRHRPELVVALNHHDYWGFGGWNSADHRAVGRAVLDAVADAGNRWIFPELGEEGLEPWGGVCWIAIAGSPRATHAVDVSATLEQAVASLAAHRAYLAALGDEAPEQQARAFVERATAATAPRFGGRPTVAFELIGR
jgi:LmbE family N-acetylglucosaminyl deacetylase